MIRTALVLALISSCALAQDWARAELEKSPRHREWVTVKHGDRTVETLVAHPEVKDKAPLSLCAELDAVAKASAGG